MKRSAIPVGNRFGRLTVVGLDEVKTKATRKSHAVVTCDCGRETTVTLHKLVSGHTQSCGCLNAERFTTHGISKTEGYTSWLAMKQRCTNPKTKQYHDYGGRGIAVCERWQDFENFYADMGPRPKNTTLDRVDNEKGYFKENCRWATRNDQQRNQRTNVLDEVSVSLIRTLHKYGAKAAKIAKELSLPYDSVYSVTNGRKWVGIGGMPV